MDALSTVMAALSALAELAKLANRISEQAQADKKQAAQVVKDLPQPPKG